MPAATAPDASAKPRISNRYLLLGDASCNKHTLLTSVWPELKSLGEAVREPSGLTCPMQYNSTITDNPTRYTVSVVNSDGTEHTYTVYDGASVSRADDGRDLSIAAARAKVLESVRTDPTNTLNGMIFSTNTIKLSISGATSPNLDLLDLPEMVALAEDPSTIKRLDDLIQKNIACQADRQLILANPAKQPLANSKAAAMIAKLEAHSRTIVMVVDPDTPEGNGIEQTREELESWSNGQFKRAVSVQEVAAEISKAGRAPLARDPPRG